jgi:hypothetical protein
MIKITCSLKKIGRKIKLKATTLLAGTLLLSNRKAPFLIAPPPNFAKTGTLPTRTQRIGATNCTRLKGKELQAKDRTPFFSPKALRAKEKGMERAKESLAKAKVYGKVRAARGNNLKVWDGRWRTRATSANKLALQSTMPQVCDLNLQPRRATNESEPSCQTKRSTSMIC